MAKKESGTSNLLDDLHLDAVLVHPAALILRVRLLFLLLFAERTTRHEDDDHRKESHDGGLTAGTTASRHCTPTRGGYITHKNV